MECLLPSALQSLVFVCVLHFVLLGLGLECHLIKFSLNPACPFVHRGFLIDDLEVVGLNVQIVVMFPVLADLDGLSQQQEMTVVRINHPKLPAFGLLLDLIRVSFR